MRRDGAAATAALTRAASAASREEAVRTRAPGRGPAAIVCREALSARDRMEHFRVRHEVFVLEQAIFAESDRDEHDNDNNDNNDNGSAIHIVGYCDGIPSGSVRVFELDRSDGLWQGDRLAVLAPFRVCGLGAPLVRCAVDIAAALGGRVMVAHVQPANVTFFTRLGWSSVDEPEIYVGLPHQQMRIPLQAPGPGASPSVLQSRHPGRRNIENSGAPAP